MGNSQSTTPDMHRSDPPAVIRKQASTLSMFTLGCASPNFSLDIDDGIVPIKRTVEEKASKSSLDPPPLYASLSTDNLEESAATAYKTFLRQYPQYQLTWTLDVLRRTDYARLDRLGETYVDYMGGSLYPESLLRVHTDFLHRNILGNTHSVSNASTASALCASEARRAVLSFFHAPPGYTVVFTANATGALKLVGESFPFDIGSSLVLGVDSHNSVHGIRQFAGRRGAAVHYVDATDRGGFDLADMQATLERNRPRDAQRSPSLLVLTGQSNVSNTKNPLSLIEQAKSQGYYTLLDAAALAATSSFSFTETPVDAMAISFYKMFGFPTGVGALIAKEDFLAKLERPWFAGGTVDVVQVPGMNVTMNSIIHERFEDGTINYLLLPAITEGLRFLSAYLPFLPIRLSSLTSHMIASLSELRHDRAGTQVVQVLSRIPKKQVTAVGEAADTGSTISVIFLHPNRERIPVSFVEYAASKHNISLRTGCMCNPGGASAILGLCTVMSEVSRGMTKEQVEHRIGNELGVVRISLGLASNFRDVHRVIEFAKLFAVEGGVDSLWSDWQESKNEHLH